MDNKLTSTGERLFLLAGALLGWGALIGQLYLTIVNREISLSETLIRYFSYYTVLTNLLAATCYTALLSGGRRSGFFTRPGTFAAVLVYILVVGITYNAILRFTWNPQGFQRVVDEALHVAAPLWFLFYWIFFGEKSGLRWNNIFGWMIFPLAYLAYVLLRGPVSGFYPYPFVDVGKLRYAQVLINAAAMFAAFLLLSLIVIAVGKSTEKRAGRV